MRRARRAGLIAVFACAVLVAVAVAPLGASARPLRNTHPAPHPRRLAQRLWRVPAFPRLIPAARAVFKSAPSPAALPPKRRPRVVGGSSATQGSFGYMATVSYVDGTGNQFLCSGTLVASNVVLTAGHCGVDETTGVPNNPGGYRIYTDAVDWTDTTDRVISGVSQVVVDPNFDPTTLYGDAAVLVLSNPVNSPTIPLWGSGQISAGTGAWVAGWGKTYSGQTFFTTALQWAPTVVQNINYCSTQAAGLNFAYNSATELCAVNPPSYDTATCNGDSGGPLLADDSTGNLMEIGITSTGPSDCDTTSSDYFTSVEPIEPWLSSEIQAVTPAPPISTPTTPATNTNTGTGPTTTTGTSTTTGTTTTTTGTTTAPPDGPEWGSYNGRTSQRKAISIYLNSSLLISRVKFGFMLRCTRHRPLSYTLTVPHVAWPLNSTSGIGIGRTFYDADGTRYVLSAVFSTTGTGMGTLRATWHTRRLGTCSTGLIRFSIH